MSNVLVTGGAGFVGSILTETLLAKGHHVTVLDSFIYGGNSLAHLCSNPNLSIIRGGAYDVGRLNILPSMDVVIPLAAIVGAEACDRDQQAAFKTNQHAIRNMCDYHLSPDQIVIIPTTNSGYGIGTPGEECTEESPLKPLTHYGCTKVAAETAVMMRTGGNSISLRLATVFGMSPRMRMDLLVNDMVWRALKDRSVVIFEGHFKRNYIHVRDVAGAFVHAIDNFAAMRGQIYNVGLTSANMSKIELCEKIKEHLPKFCYVEAAVGEDPDKRDYVVSNAKMEAAGWRPAYSLDDGIRELIKGYVGLSPMRYKNV